MSFYKSIMQVLSGHELVSDKFQDIVDTGKARKNVGVIKPPDPQRENTTAFGDYFHETGALKIDNFFQNISSYFRGDVYNFKQGAAIRRCRLISLYPEVDDALDEYAGEIYVQDITNNPDVVTVDYIDPKVFTVDLKDAIETEFKYILDLLEFRKNGYSLIKKFLVDGVVYLEKVFDENYIQRGMIDINVLDSACSTFVQEYDTDPLTGVRVLKDEYYVFSYDERSSVQPDVNPYVTVRTSAYQADFIVPKILIAAADSGTYHPDYGYALSFIHRALKVANQLKLLEDAILVYRITRAPERRAFYVDVGNLPTPQAEEFMKEIMKQHRTEKTYDVDTGIVNSNAAVINITEDFWLPRRNGVDSTKIETLPGAQNLGEINDLDYFNAKLWRALGVPFSRRLSQDKGGTPFTSGTEITVDEIKFKKKCNARRDRFNALFEDLLKTQLVIKRIINADDADAIMRNVIYRWNEDNFFYDMLNLNVAERRLDVAAKVTGDLKGYVSDPWIAREIMGQTDEEMRDLAEERKNPEKYGFTKPKEGEAAPAGGAGGGGGFSSGFGTSAGGIAEAPAVGGDELGPTGGEAAGFENEGAAPAEEAVNPEVEAARETVPEF